MTDVVFFCVFFLKARQKMRQMVRGLLLVVFTSAVSALCPFSGPSVGPKLTTQRAGWTKAPTGYVEALEKIDIEAVKADLKVRPVILPHKPEVCTHEPGFQTVFHMTLIGYVQEFPIVLACRLRWIPPPKEKSTLLFYEWVYLGLPGFTCVDLTLGQIRSTQEIL